MTASFFGSLYLLKKKNGIYLNVMPFSGEKKEQCDQMVLSENP